MSDKLVDPASNRYFDFDPYELSFRQKTMAGAWAETAMPWVLENIGEFKRDWWVVLDKEYDSLRIQFATEENEMYFAMAMCNNDVVCE